MLYSDCQNFRFRKIDNEDLPFLQALRSDPDTVPYLGNFVFLNSDSQKQWFEKVKLSQTDLYLVFEKKAGDTWEKIGLVRINDIDNTNRSMCVGGDICPEHRGNGYSKILYQMLYDLGFNTMNMNRLWLSVLDYNERARQLYKKMGFVEEGRQRQAIFRDGKYHDYIMMGILKDEYKEKYTAV